MLIPVFQFIPHFVNEFTVSTGNIPPIFRV